MTEGSHHPHEALQELIDGRLDAEARAQVQGHVAGCEPCRREMEILQWTKQTTRRVFASEGAPESLETLRRRSLNALDREDRRKATTSDERPGLRPSAPDRFPLLPALLGRLLRPVPLLVAVGVVLAVTTVVLLSRNSDIPASVARDFDAWRDGALALDLRTSDPVALEAHFAERGLNFRTRVLDLGMMRYRLVGGAVHAVGVHRSALFVYEGPEGRSLVCEMYEGRLSELPAPASIREHGGLTFRVYERNGRTLVFWEEGPVICVLTSDMPMEEVVQLAFAKAMRV